MNFALVDDRPEELTELKQALTDYACANGLELALSCYTDGESFLADYYSFRYTAVFLDIYMPGLDGIQTAKQLKAIDRNAAVVFLTTSEDHMPDAFSLHAYDYIKKPADRERVFRLLDDLTERRTEASQKRLSFRGNRQDHSLSLDEIMMIQTAEKNYLEIIARGGRTHTTRMTLTELGKELDERFLLVLRGVYVNMEYVTDFDGGLCRFADGRSLPVNVKRRRELEQTWQNFLLLSARGRKGG